jgi:hypothetical protein
MIPSKIEYEFTNSERQADHPDVNAEETYDETEDERCTEHETANPGTNGIQKS